MAPKAPDVQWFGVDVHWHIGTLAHWHIIITFAPMTTPTLTPEEQLVLAAMKLKPTAVEIERMESLVEEVQDWNYCTRLAIDRGIGPLLNHKIPMLGNSHLIPPDAQARLQQSYLRTLARSMRLYEAFREVGTALNNAGIKFVALKGVYLSEALYQDIGLRLFSDIDLLVAVEDGERSLEVLREVGYNQESNQAEYSRFVGGLREIVHYIPLTKGDISIEIHIKLHRTSKYYQLDIPTMLAEAIPVTIYGIPAHVLNPVDFLVHLCIHADKHFRDGYVQFTGYTDIINLIAQQPLDFDTFFERCEIHSCWQPFINQLRLLQLFCNASIPDEFQNKMNPTDNMEEIATFIKIFRSKKSLVATHKMIFHEIKRLKNPGIWLRYLWDVIHPDKAFMTHRYKIKNPANYRFYYLLRYLDGLKALLKLVSNFIPRRKTI